MLRSLFFLFLLLLLLFGLLMTDYYNIPTQLIDYYPPTHPAAEIGKLLVNAKRAVGQVIQGVVWENNKKEKAEVHITIPLD